MSDLTLIRAQSCVALYDRLKDVASAEAELVKDEAIISFIRSVASTNSSFAPIAKEILKMCPDSHDDKKTA